MFTLVRALDHRSSRLIIQDKMNTVNMENNYMDE